MSNRLNLTLDVTKTELQNPLIKLRQGDGNWETLRVTVTSNGEPLDLQEWTVTFMGTTAGSHKIVDASAVMVEAPNGIFDYTPTKAWGMDIGEFKIAYFKFVNGDGTASSANFRVIVDEAVDMTEEEAQDYISVVDGVIADVKEHLETDFAEISSNASEAITVSSSAVASIETTASNATATITTAESNANARFDEIEADLEAGNYVHKAGDTMTGTLQLESGGLELTADNAYIDFHGGDDKTRLANEGYGLYAKNKNNLQTLLTPIYAYENHALNFDTMAGGTPVQPGNLSVSAVVEFRASSSATGTLPPNFGGWGTLLHYAVSTNNATQLYFDTNSDSFAVRYRSGGKWKSWHSFKDAYQTGTPEFTDLADVANGGMIKYSGSFKVSADTIANSPYESDYSLEVYPGASETEGYLRVVSYSDNEQAFTAVNNGEIVGWIKVANDDAVVHKTQDETIEGDKTFTGLVKASEVVSNNPTSVDVTANGLTASFREKASGVEVNFSGVFKGNSGYKWTLLTNIPESITAPTDIVNVNMVGRGGIPNTTTQTDMFLIIRINPSRKVEYQLRHGVEGSTTDYNNIGCEFEATAFYFK